MLTLQMSRQQACDARNLFCSHCGGNMAVLKLEDTGMEGTHPLVWDEGLKPIILSLSLITICNHTTARSGKRPAQQICRFGGMLYRKVFVLVLETFPRWIRITELKSQTLLRNGFQIICLQLYKNFTGQWANFLNLTKNQNGIFLPCVFFLKLV